MNASFRPKILVDQETSFDQTNFVKKNVTWGLDSDWRKVFLWSESSPQSNSRDKIKEKISLRASFWWKIWFSGQNHSFKRPQEAKTLKQVNWGLVSDQKLCFWNSGLPLKNPLNSSIFEQFICIFIKSSFLRRLNTAKN